MSLKKLNVFFLSFFLIANSFGYSLKNQFISTEKSLPISINCIQFDVNGNVIISWNQAVDNSNSFIEYQVHTIQNGLLSTINSITTTSYTHSNVTQKYDYLIKVIYTNQAVTSTETISNIYLTVNNPSDGTALLQWNNPSNSLLTGMNPFCKIYREYPSGIWTLRDSVVYGTVFFKDTIDICQAFINYKIVVENQTCNFSSNVKGENFKDIISPNIPIISDVTIDTLNNNVIINWNKNEQNDTQGYLIYLIDNKGFPIQIANVIGISTTSYTYSADQSLAPLTYSVAAYDYCYSNSSATSFQTSAKANVHSSVKLDANLNICSKEVKLKWTEYKGWPSISNYEIWGKIKNQSWNKYGSTSTPEFIVNGEDLKNYDFAVKAISTDGRHVFSNKINVTIIRPTQPLYNILNVSVNENKIELHHSIEVTSGIKEIVYQKQINGNFETIGKLPVTQSELIFIDSNVLTDKYTYSYRAIVIDSCENVGATSNIAKTILLSIETKNNEMQNFLSWTPFENESKSVLGYKIYRGFDDLKNSELLATITKAQLSFEDYINQTNYSGKTCYYIEAFQETNKFGFSETSFSNRICTIFEPIIYIPNSFTPNNDQINDVFLPKLSIFDSLNYHLEIYDRWEIQIFESNNPEIGWNGTIYSTNKMATPGTYMYVVKLRNGNGIEIIKRGHVNLLK